MNTRALLGCCLWLLSGTVSADAPGSLTGWRGDRGIFLSWGDASKAFTIWRGSEPGKLSVLLTVPPGQSGFLDLAATRAGRYVYALGDASSHGDVLEFPGTATSAGRILAGLVTTCSGLQKGGLYPADTQNQFVASRNAHVQYFGYYLMRPFDPAPREAKMVWRDPTGAVFSEYSHSITPKRVELPDGAAGQILLAQAMGLRDALPQNGQRRVPTKAGMYSIETYLDDNQVALTVWYLREEQNGGRGGTGGTPGASPPPPAGAQPAPPPTHLPLIPISEP